MFCKRARLQSGRKLRFDECFGALAPAVARLADHDRLTINAVYSRRTTLAASVASLKFVEEQPRILRLTTPELKDVRGPVRSE